MTSYYGANDLTPRCVLCDAPVGVISNDFKLPSFQFAGDLYCEFCGMCKCPFCGVENTNLEGGCESIDVFGNPMHYDIKEFKGT